jgi:hypothetical protein
MKAPRFRVRTVGVEPNVRGHEMRRITLAAIPSEPFLASDTIEDPNAPAPDGHISLLVNAEYAKRFQPGEAFELIFRERESES